MSNNTITLDIDKRKRFAETAIKWLGVPYQHRSFSRFGCDCTGLLIGVGKECGMLKDYFPRKYPIDWNVHQVDDHIIKELKKFAVEIPKKETDIGDILVFHYAKNISHCGILISKKTLLIVHCYRTTKKVCKSIVKNSSLERRWITSFRLKNNL